MSTEKDQTRELVYLAGLLHDIGKFYQRADPDGLPKSKFVSDANKQAVSTFCPKTLYGGYSHKHVIWTLQFFDTFSGLFTDVLTKEELAQLTRLASAHHRPNPASPEERIIQLADHYSSGIDRTNQAGLADEFEEDKNDGKSNWDDFKKVRMVSIFDTLLDQKKITSRLPVSALKLDPAFFPEQREGDFDESAKRQYQTMWAAFTDELTTLSQIQNRPRSVATLAETLLYLLEKYTVTVPSSTQHLPDVSLFDHLRSTASLSVCLYDYLLATNKLTRVAVQTDEAPLLLIGGDLSGIQTFIYDIIGRSAAKNLKGRSFYLQLMVDTIVQFLLDGLQLYRGNVVYSSGGGFYILAPNTETIRIELDRLKSILTHQLRDEHGVRLFLAIDCQSVTQGEIFGQAINEPWGKLTEKLSARKRRRFADFLPTDEGFRYFFEPGEVGGESRGSRDAVTSEEFSPNEKTYPLGLDDDDANLRVRRATFEQIRLGKTLRENIQYVVLSRQPIPYWEPDRSLFGETTERHFQPLALGYFYYFVSQEQLKNLRERARGSVDNILILSVNNAETSGFRLNGNNQTYGFTFYGGNDLPRQKNQDAKYFDDLAGPADLNFRRLGILRMDVDNLGNIFKSGFDPKKRTFSRYSTLSRSLDYFFKGYLNYIWRNDPEFHEYTFILYAGGDDLFIIGKWDVALRFAKKIQEEFAAWTCHNPKLGISGGMAIVPPKFPIAKAADQSDGEEKRAKSHDLKDEGTKRIIAEKNAISFLGTPLGWGKHYQLTSGKSEWEIVAELKTDLMHYIGQEKLIPKSLLSKIGSLHGMKQEQEEKKQNPSWRWIAAYDFGRAIDRSKSVNAKAFFKQLQTDLFTNRTYKGVPLKSQYTFLDLLNVAARWAELEMRS